MTTRAPHEHVMRAAFRSGPRRPAKAQNAARPRIYHVEPDSLTCPRCGAPALTDDYRVFKNRRSRETWVTVRVSRCPVDHWALYEQITKTETES